MQKVAALRASSIQGVPSQVLGVLRAHISTSHLRGSVCRTVSIKILVQGGGGKTNRICHCVSRMYFFSERNRGGGVVVTIASKGLILGRFPRSLLQQFGERKISGPLLYDLLSRRLKGSTSERIRA